MRIALLYFNNPPFDLDTHEQKGLGGSENGFIQTIRQLVALGHTVHVYNRLEVAIDYGDNLRWRHIDTFRSSDEYDVVFSLRHSEPFQQKLNTKLRVLFLADTECVGLGENIAKGNIDLVMSVSHWQKEKIAKEENVPDDYWYVTSNGVVNRPVRDTKAFGECIFTSTIERGLTNLLDVWPAIKSQVEEAKLVLFCSFLGWGVTQEENEQMMGDVYARIQAMSNLDVINYKHANASTIIAAQQRADLYLYPSDYPETCCMSILESMMSGTIPVVTGKAGLLEKVIPNVTGAVVPAYGANSKRYQDIFVEKTVSLLKMGADEKRQIRNNCRSFASNFTYDKLVSQWVDEWKRRLAS